MQQLFDDANSSGQIGDPHPEGYADALADCHTLAVNLLQMALDREVKRCWDCVSWIGHCLRGKYKIAASEACADFSAKAEAPAQ